MSTAQRLPDELIMEIFRSEVYNHRELPSLALVSKRYLNSVRKLIYDTVYLEIMQEEDPPEGASGFVLDFPTPNLMETLETCPHLAALVRDIECQVFPEPMEKEDEHPQDRWLWSGNEGEGTTMGTALEGILQLTPNVTTLTFAEGYDVQATWADLVRKYTPNLRKIQACSISPQELKEVSNTLEFLRVRDFGVLEGLIERLELPKLTHLDIDSERLVRNEVDFLTPVFRNLRVLKVNVEIAATLDFDQMPHLEFLHLYNVDYWDRLPPSKSHIYSSASSLWKSLQLSPSLRTLGLESKPYAREWEDNLFSHGRLSKSIPTLTSLRFTDNWPLDRIASILGWNKKLSSTLERMVLNTYLNYKNPSKMRELRAVKALCQDHQIEVLYSTPVDPIWDPACELFINLTSRLETLFPPR
ncbi:hypothetical protein JCM5350_002619 [Sporobolomyces pararoseus]